MNLYLAVSEPLTEWVHDAYTPETGVPETGCIAELVIARNRSQATYLAWKTDRYSFGSGNDVRDKPKFRCEMKQRDVEGPARIATHEYPSDSPHWGFKGEGVDSE